MGSAEVDNPIAAARRLLGYFENYFEFNRDAQWKTGDADHQAHRHIFLAKDIAK